MVELDSKSQKISMEGTLQIREPARCLLELLFNIEEFLAKQVKGKKQRFKMI